MLEAGRNYVPEQETPMFQTPGEAPLRGASTPDKPFGFHDATVDGGWQVPGEPYVNTTAGGLGTLRLVARAHARRAHQSLGPLLVAQRSLRLQAAQPRRARIRLADLLRGPRAVLRQGRDADRRLRRERRTGEHAELAAGLPAAAAEAARQRSADRAAGEDARHSRGRRAPRRAHAGARPQNLPAKLHPGNAERAERSLPSTCSGRAACFWATPCGRGCSIRANYQSTTVHLPPALATGKLDILVNAMVREVTLDKDGRASGVSFVDRTTGKPGHVTARAVVLAASACETVRILLNSKSARRSRRDSPTRAARSAAISWTRSAARVDGQIPLLENLPPHNEDGASGGHMYAPWWLYKEQLAGKLGFARGYHIEFGGGRRMPALGTVDGHGVAHGRQLRPQVQGRRAALLRLVHLLRRPRRDDPERALLLRDRSRRQGPWGIPVLRFHWKWSEHETRQAAHMQSDLRRRSSRRWAGA